MFAQEMKGAVEALLFVSGEPLPLETLAKITGIEAGELAELLAGMAEEYAGQKRGWRLEEVAGGYRLVTCPEYAPYIEQLLQHPKAGLSHAALETLAIIAYRQPVTRLEIEQIRGVKADHSLANLLGKNLICEVGRKETLGRPILYGTTEEFLRHFGLRQTEELPKLDEVFVQEEIPLFAEQPVGDEKE
ncbi:SMC-Scp complex subunit ScpB [Heliophilum fasciatum]|uniref:Segregation and condensation protein B n=1 Tax=Heliophilum fasciatum TaxID=35700 RepID=A0A4R2RMA5_9FIRM|nr:SMC-Scp complex subunit ScpB [Heliophilum fasciatum]MCW2278338.1 segregation and condensation protein B [Heliophilum fasciatum]TCP63789.1 condensin subunit ScpB [Heliophilum fasciatum]